MLTQEARPRVFKEVAGHELVIKTLRAVAKNPANSPKSIILQGEYGTGKTTCARILARALNCKHASAGEPCGKCDVCTGDIASTMFYDEYDSAIVGNVETIKSLRDTFYFNAEYGYKVIVFDEVHLASGQAQSALLKCIEEVKDNIFFVFATTHIDKILPTIRSRSLELRFNLVPEDAIVANLNTITAKKNLELPPNIAHLIAQRSMGHMRNAHMLLDQYFLLGDDFLTAVKSTRDLYLQMIVSCLQGNRERTADIIYQLQHFSLADLKSDYEYLLLEIIKVALKVEEPADAYIKKIAEVFYPNLVKVIGMLKSDVIMGSFGSDKQFQTAMFLIFQMLGGNKSQPTMPGIRI